MSDICYDFIGIGLGPFNLSLACLVEPLTEVNALFLEQQAAFHWHPGMMLENATLQTPFLSDLVTLADPTHPLSFLNYKKQQGQLYQFYIRENFFLLRHEYNQYCQWALQQLSSVRLQQQVLHIEYHAQECCYFVQTKQLATNESQLFRAKKIVLGTGTQPSMPACIPLDQENIVHSAQYLDHKESLQQRAAITVIGSGQSAAEIFYDLLQDIDRYAYRLNWFTRSPRFFPLEYTKLTLEMTSPEYVNYFYGLASETKQSLLKQQQGLYKGINGHLIDEIYNLLYLKSLKSDLPVTLQTQSELRQVTVKDNQFILDFYQQDQQVTFSIPTESIIAATGYQYRLPQFLTGIHDRIAWQAPQHFQVHKDYSIDHHNEIFVQNAALASHGFVDPDLGMVCHRNAQLIKSITGVEYYPIEQQIAFQQFSAPITEVQR